MSGKSDDVLTRRHLLAAGAAAVAATAGPAAAQATRPATRPAGGRFAGKVALVTGGTGGIGRAAAEAFAREGAGVVFCGRREGLGRDVERAIRDAGGEATYVPCDVRDEGQVAALVARTVALYGGLDAAFNNAGVDKPPAPIAEMPTDAFDDQIATNLRGVFLSMKHELPHLVARGGAMVNNGSIGGRHAFPNIIGYAASKAAVLHMTRCCAREYGGRVRVNAVAPGAIETPMLERVRRQWGVTTEELASAYPAGRVGTPQEVADVVLWLCGESAGYVGGQVVGVDGGGMP